MKVELIPVIEVNYHCEDVELPKNGPYWKYPNVWQAYLSNIYKVYGFKDEFIPIFAGSGFYKPNTITDSNLVKIIELKWKIIKKVKLKKRTMHPK
jgi:hypothetical protein